MYELVEPLLSTCNSVMTSGEMPSSWSEASIIVFRKPSKDPCKMESYRPISLLNHDTKIFALRLNKIIASYIHHDQSGFIPTRQLIDNVRKSLNMIHYCSATKTSTAILALDTEKAFDRLETIFSRYYSI